MRQLVGTLGLLFTVVLSTGACGGGGGNQPAAPEKTENAAAPTTEAAASAGPLPASGPVPVGEYRTEVFEPTVSFRVDEAFGGGGKGWLVPGKEFPDSAALHGQGEKALGFSNVQKVFDPGKLPEEVLVPAPEDMVAWFREHPYLEAGEPTPANIGSVSGTQLDVAVPLEPKDSSFECTTPCIPGWDLSEEADSYRFFPGYKVRLFVLDVEGETVIVDIESPEETFEGFLPKAQEVLDTVQWETGP